MIIFSFQSKHWSGPTLNAILNWRGCVSRHFQWTQTRRRLRLTTAQTRLTTSFSSQQVAGTDTDTHSQVCFSGKPLFLTGQVNSYPKTCLDKNTNCNNIFTIIKNNIFNHSFINSVTTFARCFALDVIHLCSTNSVVSFTMKVKVYVFFHIFKPLWHHLYSITNHP